MSHRNLYPLYAGILLLLIGVALVTGGLQLLVAGGEMWPDVTATATVIKRTAWMMLLLALLMLLTAIAVIKKHPWAMRGAWMALGLFVVAGFAGNYLLFGSIRLLHSGTNIVLGLVIIVLLVKGVKKHNPEPGN